MNILFVKNLYYYMKQNKIKLLTINETNKKKFVDNQNSVFNFYIYVEQFIYYWTCKMLFSRIIPLL